MGIAPVIAAYTSSKWLYSWGRVSSHYAMFFCVSRFQVCAVYCAVRTSKLEETTSNAIISVNQEKITTNWRNDRRYYLNWAMLRIWKRLFFPTWRNSSNSGSNFMSFKSPLYECLSTNCYISFLVDDLPRGKQTSSDGREKKVYHLYYRWTPLLPISGVGNSVDRFNNISWLVTQKPG